MSAAKIATARRKHPRISLAIWHDLPRLLAEPIAAFPSARRDGSIVVVTVADDEDGNPIIAPIVWDDRQRLNVVLSVYPKTPDQGTGADWAKRELAAARREGLPCYERNGPIGTEPKPGSAEAIPKSPGLIPVDRPMEPRRKLLTIARKVKDRGPSDPSP